MKKLIWKDLSTDVQNLLELVDNPFTGEISTVTVLKSYPFFYETLAYLKGPEGQAHFKIVEIQKDRVLVSA